MECKLKSHPDRLLKHHLLGTHTNGMEIFQRNAIFSEHEQFISAILLLHDLGKASSYFQTYIAQEASVYEKYKRHAEISALWFYFYAIEILKLNSKYSAMGYIIIKYHHGDLNNFNKMCMASLNQEDLYKISNKVDYKEVQGIYSSYLRSDFFNNKNFLLQYSRNTRKGSIKFERALRKTLSLDDYFLLNYFFSILLTADKADAILHLNVPQIENRWQPDFVDHYKEKFDKNENILTRVRNQAYKEVQADLETHSRIFSTNLPTGSGKTLTVLNAALKLKKIAAQCNKIIYCLPFTSVIDQNAKVFEDILDYNGEKITSDKLLTQHHLSQLSYIKHFSDEDRIYSSKDSEFLIEGWESELVVTTFYQLLHTLLSNKNKNLRKFHKFANSIVILDEVQSIPHKYWELVKQILILSAKIFNIRFILVTATMPLIFSEKAGEIKELAQSKQHYFNSLNRIGLNTSFLKREINIDDFKELLVEDIRSDPLKSRLVILNTVKSALEVFNCLKDECSEKDLIFLSSNIIPKHRLERILNIKNNPKGKIVVSTQMVEAGVDIDMDFVYRDLAPLDSIFQACGRCNRENDGERSEVRLFILKNNQKPYYSYIYDKILIDATLSVLKNKQLFEEKEFLTLSNIYFDRVTQNAIGPESEKILENMGKLFLKKSFQKDNENKDPVFELIETFPVVSVFIEIDESATKIYREYKEILKKDYSDPFQKRIDLKKKNKEMALYTINVPEQNAKDAGYDETMGKVWFVPLIIKDSHYEVTTGFIRDNDIDDYIF